MELREIALGGVFFSPLLLYGMLGLGLTLATRTLMHRLFRHSPLWSEPWFDIALFVIAMAAVALLFSLLY